MLPAFVVLVALGFVITVIISWAFEMTPEGLKRTADVTPGEVIPYWSKRKFAAFVIGTAVVAFGLLAYQLLRSTGGQLSAKQRTDKILIQGNPAGTQTIEIQPDGTVRAEYSYNDRGRGDHITATWKLDSAGVPIEYDGRGNDYMKAPIEEHFEIKNGRATLEEPQRTRRASCLWRSLLPADEFAPGILRCAGARAIEGTEPQTAAPTCRRSND